MKKIIPVVFAILALMMLISCEYDNYDEPGSVLEGRFVYNDRQVGVKNDLDVIRLYEEGWQNMTPIDVSVNHNGIFRAALFDGDYRLALSPGSGPWEDIPDTLDFRLEGSRVIDIPVQPFFWISNETFEVNGSELTATFDLEKVTTDRELHSVALFVGNTSLVDEQYNAKDVRINAEDINGPDDPVSITIDIAGIREDFLYARIGVRATGNQQFIFSPAKKIEF
ncbi:DUF3823 domain-containing protein [Sinomicrobium soli]|uniref:DUF3823 domain-containing protein n=1 Tax=Sinomicrobium sp. N-1-3-6 TaxID=2219864 RepID=UPI000DCC51D5|nr:DUF3823 domain-containing protein [Sinomicrobium sp. N-1-3-6]RAV27534.1 hypothetical protein DN748_18175 [Sinomicrobium sp. N-1-3-6]